MKIKQLSLLGALFAVLISQPANAVTEIRVYSEDGDHVGGGGTFVFTEANGTLTVEKGFRDDVKIEWQNLPDFFSFEFEGPDAQQLVPGLYEDAEGYPFQGPGLPGLAIFGMGAGCNTLTGSFEVHEVEYDQDGTPVKLAIDAIQFCEYGARSLKAEIRFNSDVSFDLGPRVRTIDDFAILPGSQVDVGLQLAATTNGAITDYSWTQINGQPVTFSGADTDTISFIAPVVDAEYEVLQFEVTITDSIGETASDTVTVISSENTIPQSRFLLLTTPGGFIGGGQSREEDIDTTYFSTERWGNGVRIDYLPPDGSGWRMTLAAPFIDDLSVDQYDLAYSTPFRPANKPGIEFGLVGRSCNRLTGEFSVLDIGYAANRAIERLALDASIVCHDLGADPILVRLRFDTVIPMYSRAPAAEAGPDQLAFAGDTVALDAYASHDDFGVIESYRWQQVSGPEVTLGNANTELATFVAPDVAQGQGLAEFLLTVTNDAGLSDTEAVLINILGSEDAKNVITLEVIPGTGFDFVTNTNGTNLRFDDNTGSFSIRQDLIQTSVVFSQFSSWHFGFGQDGWLPDGDPDLPPGLYENATRNEPGLPWILVSGDGRGCNLADGRFVVHEFVKDANGDVASMAIDFETSCDYGAPLYGVIRFNSTVPLEAPGLFASAGNDVEAVPGQLVDLDADGSYIGPSNDVSYQWEQVSGPAVTITNANQPITTFSAPGAAGIAVFRVTITTSEGLIDTALVTVNLLGSGVPMTAMYLQSEPGEPLGRGILHYFGADEVRGPSYEPAELSIADFSNRMYRLTLSTPNGETFAPGDFTNAFGFGAVPGFPGIDLEFNVRGCQSAVGWYRIHELEPSADQSRIEKIAVDFWQSCEFDDPPIYGSLRINSTIPLRTDAPVATAGRNVIGRTGTDVILSAAQSFSWDAPITGYAWTQVSGPVANIANGNSASPIISLPQVAGSSEDLVFEVTVSNGFGNQSTARTTVTVLASDVPWNEFKIVLFDPTTKEEISSMVVDANNGHFEYDESATRVDIFATGREATVQLGLDTGNLAPQFAPGIYHRFDYRDDGFPYLNTYIYLVLNCNYTHQGWMHITDSEVTNGLVSSLAYEAEQVCDNGIGIRVSGRLNSTIPINYGKPIVIQGVDRTVGEGETAYIEDVVGYIEGELAQDTSWQQLSGPPAILALLPNARTSFVGPAVSGDDTVELRLSVTSKSQQTYTGDVSFSVTENNIAGFPAGLITTNTAAGTYGATGKTIAIESNHVVVLHTRAATRRFWLVCIRC